MTDETQIGSTDGDSSSASKPETARDPASLNGRNRALIFRALSIVQLANQQLRHGEEIAAAAIALDSAEASLGSIDRAVGDRHSRERVLQAQSLLQVVGKHFDHDDAVTPATFALDCAEEHLLALAEAI